MIIGELNCFISHIYIHYELKNSFKLLIVTSIKLILSTLITTFQWSSKKLSVYLHTAHFSGAYTPSCSNIGIVHADYDNCVRTHLGSPHIHQYLKHKIIVSITHVERSRGKKMSGIFIPQSQPNQ